VKNLKIICRTPVRINLGNGGDTDYYIEKIGWGCVINATLSSHFYEFIVNNDNLSKIDIVDYFDYIKNLNRNYILDSNVSELDLLKTTMRELNINIPNSFLVRTNVPMKSGLGGSSALNVAMISALLVYKKNKINPNKVASKAYTIERERINIPGGYQDQYASAYGRGFNYMEFRKDNIKITPLKLSEEIIKKLEKNILLYYISEREISGKNLHLIQKGYIEENPNLIKRLLIKKRNNVLKIKKSLISGRLDKFGELIRIDGEIKNKLSGNIDDFSNKIMNLAINNGALGGKLCGAGSGGGCMYFYVPDENLNNFRKAMSEIKVKEMNFRFQRHFEPGIQIRMI